MRRILFVIASLLAAISASAQEPNRFRLRVGAGTVTGTEEFSIVDTPKGHDLSAKATILRGGTTTTFTLRESLTPDWLPTRYDIAVGSQAGDGSVSAERTGETLKFSAKLPTGEQTKDVPVTPRTVLLDNLLAAPFQVLLSLTAAAPGPVTLVVPLQLATVESTLGAAGTAPATLDGRSITVNRLRLSAGGVTIEIYAEAGTNRFLRMFVPLQDAELVREGFVMEGAGGQQPAAVRPAGVTERELAFKQIAGQAYPAVLCLPAARTPVPLLVLIQGSGPNDRDESIGPNKPFRDLAWGLAQRGIATLRFDKRTRAFPRTYAGTLESESIEDAVDAVTFAQTLPEVDRTNIFVLGHSLGGLVAPYVAQRVPVRGLILMAAAGRTLDLVIRDQVEAACAGMSPDQRAEILKQQDEVMAKVRAGTATLDDLRGQAPPAALRDTIVRDPLVELRKTTVPLLVLKGDKDAQVFQADFDALQALARTRAGSEARLFPNLTHIFTLTQGPPDMGAIALPAPLAPEVIDTIAAWVTRTARK